jgi:hypothetical protein
MAGSWERTKFDDNEYKNYIKETTGPLLYRLDPNRFYNCQECRPEQPGYIGTGVSISKKDTLVNVESELRGITRPLTRDPKGKYLPCKKPGGSLKHMPSCNVMTDETRMSNPACNLRGTGVSQHIFYEVCQNPQEISTLEHPGKILIDDRQAAKDCHRPEPHAPIDINPSLPKDTQRVKMPKCCPTSAGWELECVFTDPLFNNYQNIRQHKNLHVQPALEYNYERIMAYHNKI